MKKAIYLDYAASTPIDKKVLEAMMPYMRRQNCLKPGVKHKANNHLTEKLRSIY